MSSNILTIYDQIAATSITVNGTAVTVKDADQLPNRVASADLPIRLITPISGFGVEGAQTDSVWAGGSGSTVRQVEWQIFDVMLWKPIALDVGVKAWAKELLAYSREYFDMLEDLTLTGAVYLDANLTHSVIEYPLLSGVFYAGVRATLTIREKW